MFDGRLRDKQSHNPLIDSRIQCPRALYIIGHTVGVDVFELFGSLIPQFTHEIRKFVAADT